MELIYIWIAGYKNIYDAGIIFNSEYKVNYYPQDNKIDIDYESNSLKLYNENIHCITALIGKNGSGKSNMLSFLKDIFSNSPINISGDYLLIVKKKDNNLLIVDKTSGTDISINANNLTYQLTNITQELKECTDLIFFSNSFSIHDELAIYRSYHDASLSSMLFENSQNSNKFLLDSYDKALKHYNYPQSPEPDSEFITNRNYLIRQNIPHGFIYSRELQNQFKFISQQREHNFDFIPKEVQLSFNALLINLEENSAVYSGLNKIEFIINLLYDREINPMDNIRKGEILKENLVLSLFLHIWKNNLFSETTEENYENANNIINDTKDIDSLPQRIKEYILSCEPRFDDTTFEKIQNFISTLDQRINNIVFIPFGYTNSVTIGINESLLDLINELFTFWYDSQFVFHFIWHGLSAGENALLRLFSRLNIISEKHLKDTIWLLIDEGELYLHPEWQRNFIHDLNNYLPKFFATKKLQIIISSHSPFIASDIPKGNIIWMDKSEEGLCTILDKTKMPETFGANIHELLANSFFLKQGSLGKFSLELIQDIMNRMAYNDELSDSTNRQTLDEKIVRSFNRFKEINEVKPYIEIIGEPLIKQRLTEMYNETEGQIFDKDMEIMRLREQISKLESDLEKK